MMEDKNEYPVVLKYNKFNLVTEPYDYWNTIWAKRKKIAYYYRWFIMDWVYWKRIDIIQQQQSKLLHIMK